MDRSDLIERRESVENVVIVEPPPGAEVRLGFPHHHGDQPQVVHRIVLADRLDRPCSLLLEIDHQCGEQAFEETILRGSRPAEPSAQRTCPLVGGLAVSRRLDFNWLFGHFASPSGHAAAPARTAPAGSQIEIDQKEFGTTRTRLPSLRELICFSIRSVKAKITVTDIFSDPAAAAAI